MADPWVKPASSSLGNWDVAGFFLPAITGGVLVNRHGGIHGDLGKQKEGFNQHQSTSINKQTWISTTESDIYQKEVDLMNNTRD